MSFEIRPIKPGVDWPLRHLNAGTAGVKQLLAAPGNSLSHFVTGFVLSGGATTNGFHLLRRNCLVFNGNTDTFTIPDNATDLDWANKAGDGDFSLEMWVRMPAATGAIAGLMKRGDPAADGWALEITSAGVAKFTMHDGTAAAVAITGTRPLQDDAWHLITVTVDRSSTTGLNLYIDGVSDATAVDITSVTDAMDGGTTAVCTGIASKTFYVSAIGMYVDSFLAAATVLSNYNSGIGQKYSGTETGLTFGYNCDEGVGTTVYPVSNTAAHNVTIANTAWAPSRAAGSTAAVTVCGVPFDADDSLDAIGKFVTGVLSTNGYLTPTAITFPHAIRIGRNNPLRILETDGAWDLVLFGFTDGYA